MKKFALAAAIAAASVTPALANETTPAQDDLTILSTQGVPLAGALGGVGVGGALAISTLILTAASVAGASSGTGTN